LAASCLAIALDVANYRSKDKGRGDGAQDAEPQVRLSGWIEHLKE
jgi:hypothetical protein